MFETPMRPLYAVWSGVAVIALIFIYSLGFTVTATAALVLVLPLALLVTGLLARRIGYPKVALALEGNALLYFGGIVLMFLLFPMTAVSGPYADSMLSGWDQRLGFNWFTYLEYSRPITRVLQVAYNSFGWQPALVVIILAATSRILVLRQFMLAVFFASMITAAIFPLVPAEAPFAFYNITPEMYPELKATGTRDFLIIMEAVREGHRVISPEVFTGVVAFPSFHAAMAVVLIWAFWSLSFLRWPAVLLNFLMLASTPVIGNHYLVDILGGIAVASVSLLLARHFFAGKGSESASNSKNEPNLK